MINRHFAFGIWLIFAFIFGLSLLLENKLPLNTWKIMHYGSMVIFLLPVAAFVIAIVLYPFGLAYEDALDKKESRLLPKKNISAKDGFEADAAALNSDMEKIGKDFENAKKIL